MNNAVAKNVVRIMSPATAGAASESIKLMNNLQNAENANSTSKL